MCVCVCVGMCVCRYVCVYSEWVCVSLYGNHAFMRVTSTKKYLVFLFMAIMLLYRSCQLRSICLCSLWLCLCVLFMATMLLCGSCQLRSVCVLCVCICVAFSLCVCSLYGDHAFAGHVDWESSCVSLYGDHAFVWVMSTEKYICECVVCVSVCVFSLRRPCFCAGHVDWEVCVCICAYV